MIWHLFYLMIFGATLALSLALCEGARRAALRLGWLDIPGGRKAHARPVAVTGGYGIFAAFLCVVGGGLLLSGPAAGIAAGVSESAARELQPYLENIAGVRGEVLAVLAGATLMFVTGAVDDRRALGPRMKLAVQVVAVVPLLVADIGVRGHLPVVIGWGATALWVVAVTNSFNLLDNMDGLSASVAAVVCGVLAIAALQGGELWLPALFLALAGALAGFLCFNWHPARMFMGDAGSLTVGYLVAVFSILVTYQDVAGGSTATPLKLLMPWRSWVPLFDTASVMWIRWRGRRPLMFAPQPFQPPLLAMGLPYARRRRRSRC